MDEKYKFGAEAVWILSRDNKGRTTNIITGFPTKFDISKLPDGTQLYTTTQPDRVAELEETNKKLLDALEEIASRTQDTNLLWWQITARQAIAEAEGK